MNEPAYVIDQEADAERRRQEAEERLNRFYQNSASINVLPSTLALILATIVSLLLRKD